MPKYDVTLIFTASKTLRGISARNKQEAEEKALDHEDNHANLCHQCTEEVELDDVCAHRAIADEIKPAKKG